MGRGKTWCDEEDEALARHTKNSIQGTDQKITAFWEDVYQRAAATFNGEARPGRPSKIAGASFFTMLQNLPARNESGKNEEDHVNDAVTLYQDSHGSRFEYLSCWMILYAAPKFAAFIFPPIRSVAMTSCQTNTNRLVHALKDEIKPIRHVFKKQQLTPPLHFCGNYVATTRRNTRKYWLKSSGK
ncbi:hypothetical protein PHMEG_0009123 [Phytophthora megakarya]|uniref:Uncharacterized protein n=1 Tax=Phytophthora megakarya TaxID=4795 RepID=A0A225WH09_9STRA|nr:hypothetical protein PHMEG_0009123 [Phytophthora megakarya]